MGQNAYALVILEIMYQCSVAKKICKFRRSTVNEISWYKISNFGSLKLNESCYIGGKMSTLRRHIHENKIKYLILQDYFFFRAEISVFSKKYQFNLRMRQKQSWAFYPV